MSDLVIEYLRQFREGQLRMESKLDDLTQRVSALEVGQALVVSHIGHLESNTAAMQAGMDKINGRIDRIERRLALRDE